MDNYVAREIYDYSDQIVKKTIGTNTVIDSVEWSAGGLFNKVFYVNTNQGQFILKIECDTIFISTRMNQIENEVYASDLLLKAGVPCAPVLSHDFSKNEVGVRYVFSQRITNDILCLDWNNFSKIEKEKIQNEVVEIFNKINHITNSKFGSLYPDGIIGQHNTWDACYHTILHLLIHDCKKLELMTDEELSVVEDLVTQPLSSSNSVCTPTFNHGDLGMHNTIFGSLDGGKNRVYLIDFGDAMFGLPAFDEYMTCKMSDFGFEPRDILREKSLDKRLYENILPDFERFLFTASEKYTNDYAHCTNWLTDIINQEKADTSRTYITDFIAKCTEKLL